MLFSPCTTYPSIPCTTNSPSTHPLHTPPTPLPPNQARQLKQIPIRLHITRPHSNPPPPPPIKPASFNSSLSASTSPVPRLTLLLASASLSSHAHSLLCLSASSS